MSRSTWSASERYLNGFVAAFVAPLFMPQRRLDKVRRAIQPASFKFTSLCAENGIKSSTFLCAVTNQRAEPKDLNDHGVNRLSLSFEVLTFAARYGLLDKSTAYLADATNLDVPLRYECNNVVFARHRCLVLSSSRRLAAATAEFARRQSIAMKIFSAIRRYT